MKDEFDEDKAKFDFPRSQKISSNDWSVLTLVPCCHERTGATLKLECLEQLFHLLREPLVLDLLTCTVFDIPPLHFALEQSRESSVLQLHLPVRCSGYHWFEAWQDLSSCASIHKPRLLGMIKFGVSVSNNLCPFLSIWISNEDFWPTFVEELLHIFAPCCVPRFDKNSRRWPIVSSWLFQR